MILPLSVIRFYLVPLFTFRPVPVPLVEKRNIRIPSIYPGGMFCSAGNEIPVPFRICPHDAINGQIYPPLDDDAPLALMGMLSHLDILGEFHEDYLMIFGLRKIGLGTLQWDIGFRQIFYRLGKCFGHIGSSLSIDVWMRTPGNIAVDKMP